WIAREISMALQHSGEPDHARTTSPPMAAGRSSGWYTLDQPGGSYHSIALADPTRTTVLIPTGGSSSAPTAASMAQAWEEEYRETAPLPCLSGAARFST